MRDPVPDLSLENRESDPPRYTSFILRCWTGETGQVRARLVNVHSGVSHLVADLADLPRLVHNLVAEDDAPLETRAPGTDRSTIVDKGDGCET